MVKCPYLLVQKAMKRRIIAILLFFSFFPAAIADPAPTPPAEIASMRASCYAKIGPLLRNSDGKLTPDVRNAYLEWSESAVLDELHKNDLTIPADCLSEVQNDDTLRSAIFGSVFPPDASILQNYAELRADMGQKFMAKYRSLAIAVSVAKRTKGVESADSCKSIGMDYNPYFWTDESLHAPGSDSERDFIRRLANFMDTSQIAALDLYQNPADRQQLKDALSQQIGGAAFIPQVGQNVQFGQYLMNAMVILGKRPAARDPKPSTEDWLAHLAANNDATPSSTPTTDGKPMPWPLFPIDTAPWPLLMPLAHPVPISEADYIWEAFQGEHGSDRFHTYGPYRDDDDVMPDSFRPSRWFWDAWPDRIIHGGECVPISKGTVELYSSLGEPAMWAGQPGHANLMIFSYGAGKWPASIEQDYAGGPTLTSAQWFVRWRGVDTTDIDCGYTFAPRKRNSLWAVGIRAQSGIRPAAQVGDC